MLPVLFAGLAWVDKELLRMKPPRLLHETPAYPDLAGSDQLIYVIFVGVVCVSQ